MTTRFPRKIALLLAVVAAASGVGGPARADLITTFQDALRPTTPAAGWSYLYNSGGAIGNPANYTALVATTDPYFYYTVDGGGNLPRPDPGAYLYLGLNWGEAGGHPGRGSDETRSGNIERYAIAAYQLSVGGSISLTDGLLTNADNSLDGLNLRVYVNGNPTPIYSGATSSGMGQTLSFDTNLGFLNAGDTIYVAIGSRFVGDSDSFRLRYGITLAAASVPEPASLPLLGIAGPAGWGLARARRRPIGGRSRSRTGGAPGGDGRRPLTARRAGGRAGASGRRSCRRVGRR